MATVKVLDFGLAKAVVGDTTSRDLSQSPTLTVNGTRDGIILGTAAYMSPEQARGKPVDKRTDVWAFGCVLYEMLIGRAAFAGDTISDTIASILGREPEWSALQLPAKPAPSAATVSGKGSQASPSRHCGRADRDRGHHQWRGWHSRGWDGRRAHGHSVSCLRWSIPVVALVAVGALGWHLLTDRRAQTAAPRIFTVDDLVVGYGGARHRQRSQSGNHARRYASRLCR